MPAVALGLIPALAGWALVIVQNSIGGTDLYAAAPELEARIHLSGIVALSQGSLISAMTLSSIMVYILIDDSCPQRPGLGPPPCSLFSA